MLELTEARARLLDGVARLGAERVPLHDAGGRVLAEALVAREPLPRFDHSAMDGYAVALADLEGDGPWTLRVHGESGAGAPGPALDPRTACRIFTGAELPSRADAVIMQEYVTREGDRMTFAGPRPRKWAHVRRAGEDLTAGATALAEGTRLGVGALALAGMLDRPELLVARRPVVTVVCTGDELRAPGDPPRPASIPESNSAPLSFLAARAGATVRVAPIARDTPAETARALEEALPGTDLLVTVGGVSVGDHDVVRPSLERAGITLDFWKVAIKPGKPLAVGRGRGTRAIGLPGNPASALVTFALFGMPLLRAMQGDLRPFARPLVARLGSDRPRSKDRLELVRARLEVEEGALVAVVLDNQSSGAATSLAGSDGLALIPMGEGVLAKGALVEFLRWGDA
jgi:molybdopterin molybdotransferase